MDHNLTDRDVGGKLCTLSRTAYGVGSAVGGTRSKVNVDFLGLDLCKKREILTTLDAAL